MRLVLVERLPVETEDGALTFRPWDHYGQADVLTFETEWGEGWWNGVHYSPLNYRWLSIFEGDTEVARVEIELGSGDFSPDFVPPITEPAQGFAQIIFFEVHRDHRRRGLGRACLAALRERFVGWQLAAFALEVNAEPFWSSTAAEGWRRHQVPGGFHGPLFISP